MTQGRRPTALGLLDVLVGEWTQLVSGHGDPTGTMPFDWSLDDRYLLQRSTLPSPFPDSLAVIEYVEIADEFRQHYFDTRGVSRLYRMTLVGPDLMLLRLEADFSPLGFAQRFIGIIQDDERSVEGAWQQSHDAGTTWEHDFGLRLERRP
jgi:hypothetical protein